MSAKTTLSRLASKALPAVVCVHGCCNAAGFSGSSKWLQNNNPNSRQLNRRGLRRAVLPTPMKINFVTPWCLIARATGIGEFWQDGLFSLA